MKNLSLVIKKIYLMLFTQIKIEINIKKYYYQYLKKKILIK